MKTFKRMSNMEYFFGIFFGDLLLIFASGFIIYGAFNQDINDLGLPLIIFGTILLIGYALSKMGIRNDLLVKE